MILHHLFSGGAPGPREPAGLGPIGDEESSAGRSNHAPRQRNCQRGEDFGRMGPGRVSGAAYSLISNSTISALLRAPVPRARSISEMAGFGDRRISADSPGPNMLMSLL
jgi:hypothetical protein